MAGQRITVVISQAQSKNPQLRALEEDIATQLMLDGKVEVSLVPHLYDLTTDHPGMLFLKSVPGDLIVLSWLYPRASRWILDRNGISGQEGKSELKSEEEEEVDEEELQPSANAIGARDVPNRKIYTIDLRARDQAADFLGEIQRIASSAAVQTVELLDWIGGTPRPDQMQQYLNPQKNDNGNGELVNGNGNGHIPADSNGHRPIDLEGGPVKRRWYPVIDYSRCTNCMECIDFCLFGVYGVDGAERILVEQQDNCKKGCPACSRVCPENAIIFPGHKTPAIAGSEEGGIGNLKIDLSKLFGAPSAMELAAQERDTELVADGREAVGMTVGIPKRQDSQPQKRDQLDDLIDGLDDLDF
ncbi:4Fe-4S binding domain protein [Symmachiella dynata]|uniref:ATP-binding protein n=1 Tax=Symmachiella dynata TaxID=2527995 RepID=UPI00118C955B|nr:ferredoxin family protein [Symmachiella dynata]QDT50743.1 4Fe-4S binding domain protein [Symmachiella dynata]